ncbi:MAG: hypothetical protein ABIS86_08320 [Streptosporangiaceae bacterium]
MSTKTVAQKLLIKPDTTLWISDPAHLGLLAGLDESVRTVDTPAEATAALVFADSAASLREILAKGDGGFTEPAVLWICYPKAGRADIHRDTVWPIVGEHGLRPNGQVAVDDTWSALRFRPLKEGEAPFQGGAGRPAQ